jgi:hypothetical protein
MSQQPFEQVISLIDAVNCDDPNREIAENKEWPKEHLYSVRMSKMLAHFKPDADELLKIAVHGQHIQRWKSSRSDYPMGRQGYHQWRTNLYTFHAESVASLMVQAGFDEIALDRVKSAVSKKSIKINPDSQLVEDIAGLVFIEHYMLAFAEKHPEYSQEKWIGMISKTWKKMSNDAHQFVLAGKIKLPAALQELIHQAIA